jgi:DNA-binding transcriptional LysR family regulator
VDLTQLETFRKVSSVNSFTRAAAELRYAQSTVTAHIKALESELNVSLFERYGRGVQITTAGKHLLTYVDDILSLVSQARKSLHADREPSGLLVIGTPESVASYRLPPLLELFRYRYPKVRLSLRPTSGSQIRRALRDREFDAAFLLGEDGQHRGLASVNVCEEPLALVAAPDHPLVAEPEIDADQLRRTDLLGAEPGSSYHDKLLELLAGADSESMRMLEFGTIEAIKRTAQARLGVALLPLVAVADELSAGSLVELPWPSPFRIYTQLAWNEAQWVSPELKLFISAATSVLREEAAIPQPRPARPPVRQAALPRLASCAAGVLTAGVLTAGVLTRSWLPCAAGSLVGQGQRTVECAHHLVQFGHFNDQRRQQPDHRAVPAPGFQDQAAVQAGPLDRPGPGAVGWQAAQ